MGRCPAIKSCRSNSSEHWLIGIEFCGECIIVATVKEDFWVSKLNAVAIFNTKEKHKIAAILCSKKARIDRCVFLGGYCNRKSFRRSSGMAKRNIPLERCIRSYIKTEFCWSLEDSSSNHPNLKSLDPSPVVEDEWGVECQMAPIKVLAPINPKQRAAKRRVILGNNVRSALIMSLDNCGGGNVRPRTRFRPLQLGFLIWTWTRLWVGKKRCVSLRLVWKRNTWSRVWWLTSINEARIGSRMTTLW